MTQPTVRSVIRQLGVGSSGGRLLWSAHTTLAPADDPFPLTHYGLWGSWEAAIAGAEEQRIQLVLADAKRQARQDVLNDFERTYQPPDIARRAA